MTDKLRVAGIIDFDGNQFRPEWVEICMGMRELYSCSLMGVGFEQLKEV